MDYNMLFNVFWRFKTLIDYDNFCNKLYFGLFDQKAWAISYVLDPFVAIFNLQLIMLNFIVRVSFILAICNLKALTINHDFDRSWSIFDYQFIIRIFGINYIFAILGNNAWTLNHDFDRFMAFFDPQSILL